MIARTQQTIEELLARGERLTYARVARTAGVSRAWLYREACVRQVIDDALAEIRSRPRPGRLPMGQSDASKDARIRNLLEDNRRLRSEVQAVRARLSVLMGQVRELQGGRGA